MSKCIGCAGMKDLEWYINQDELASAGEGTTVEAPLLYQRIGTYLLDEIRRGALGPGDRVGSEMELAAQFEVSRITSKRALEVLREAGVIERIRGKGSFVVKNLPDLDGV